MAAGNPAAAGAFIEKSIDQTRVLGQPLVEAQALASAAMFYVMAGELDRAEPMARRALHIARPLQSLSVTMSSLISLAGALAEGDPETARVFFLEADELWPRDVAGNYTLTQMVFVGARLRQWNVVRKRGREVVRFLHWHGDRPQFAGILNMEAAAIAADDPEAAATMLGIGSALVADELHPGASNHVVPSTPSVNFVRDLRRSTSERIRGELGHERFDELRRAGRAMRYEDVLPFLLDVLEQWG
jgi:hypothetical protein